MDEWMNGMQKMTLHRIGPFMEKKRRKKQKHAVWDDHTINSSTTGMDKYDLVTGNIIKQ